MNEVTFIEKNHPSSVAEINSYKYSWKKKLEVQTKQQKLQTKGQLTRILLW